MDSCVNQDEFNAFCNDHYPPGIVSKTMRRERLERITGWLKGDLPPPLGTWRYRIVDKGYRLLMFPDTGDSDVLCLKGTESDGQIEKGKYGEWRRVVPVEEFYDILQETHVEVQNHGGYRRLRKMLEANYTGIPRLAATKFISMCTVCQKNPRQQPRSLHSREKVTKLPGITRDFNRRCQIDVLDMTQNPDGHYSHIGLFTDHWTKFITLFPMMGCSPEHVAYGLASSVYPYYGTPHFLHSTEGKDFAKEVIRLSMEKWRGGEKTIVPQAKEQLMHMAEVVEGTRASLINLVNNRAVGEAVKGPIPWAGWLGKIMYDINSQKKSTTGKSSYKRVFERTLVSKEEHGEPSAETRPKGIKDNLSPSVYPKCRKRKSSSADGDDCDIVTSQKKPRTFVSIDLKKKS